MFIEKKSIPSIIWGEPYWGQLTYREFEETLVKEPFNNYMHILNRMGIDCIPNVILASVSIHRVYDSKRHQISRDPGGASCDYYVEEIKTYYKKSDVSKKYSNKILSIDYYNVNKSRKEILTDLVIDFINTENLSNTVNNEYIRYVCWDEEIDGRGEGLSTFRNPKKEWKYNLALIEYSKNSLKNFRDLSLYNYVKEEITDWGYSKESNYIEDTLIKQGRKIINDFLYLKYKLIYDLYDKIHNLSLLKYEGQENNGGILFCKEPPNPEMESFIKLKNRIKLNDTKNLKSIRKLLEISSDNIFLLCDGINIYGFIKVPTKSNLERSSFFIKFKSQGCWELKDYLNNSVIQVSYGVPSLSKQVVDETDFFNECKETFGVSKYSDKIWDFVSLAMQQKHGTMVVITDSAVEESKRLRKNSFVIDAKKIYDAEFVLGLTSIDGAIMLDPWGNCHAIGCILDGVSDTAIGDSSRGARYNSALRYINYCQSRNSSKEIRVIIIVVSEDGMINILTKKDIPVPKRS